MEDSVNGTGLTLTREEVIGQIKTYVDLLMQCMEEATAPEAQRLFSNANGKMNAVMSYANMAFDAEEKALGEAEVTEEV